VVVLVVAVVPVMLLVAVRLPTLDLVVEEAENQLVDLVDLESL
tara:strand:+ start:695 stop:823 length:129 start_codon:yes stop_codon:yes gene_type:complete